jgi:hypothetical protein
MQVNYDFHDDLTPAKVDEILAEYRRAERKGWEIMPTSSPIPMK